MPLRFLKEEDFLDEADMRVFEIYLDDPSAVLMEMANVIGNKVKVEYKLPFSFYFCDKDAVHQQHAIRAKILWNPSKAPSNADGYMELHGDYKYTISSHKYKPISKELSLARDFFRKYKVLFAAVWEEKLNSNDLVDYFNGNYSWRELLACFDLKGKDYYNVNHCNNLNELEKCVRENKIFNMND